MYPAKAPTKMVLPSQIRLQRRFEHDPCEGHRAATSRNGTHRTSPCCNATCAGADLASALSAAGRVAAASDCGGLRLPALGLAGAAFGTPPGTVLASIEIKPTPALRALQAAFAAALAPYAAPGGTVAAFFAAAGEPHVNTATVTYVEGFVPERTGALYAPHLTVGVANEGFLRELTAKPFAEVVLSPSAVGVYRIGNLGAARQVLARWPCGRRVGLGSPASASASTAESATAQAPVSTRSRPFSLAR